MCAVGWYSCQTETIDFAGEPRGQQDRAIEHLDPARGCTHDGRAVIALLFPLFHRQEDLQQATPLEPKHQEPYKIFLELVGIYELTLD